jgi:hypothetical protein
MRAALALALLLAACGERGPSVSRNGATPEQIARAAAPRVEHPDLQAPARIQPLTAADLAGAGLTAPACDFSRDGAVLLAVGADDALARVAGTLLHLAHASPAGPTGGFFEDGEVSISVGRVGETPPADSLAGSWPGRLTVTNRRHHVGVELQGLWRCRG